MSQVSFFQKNFFFAFPGIRGARKYVDIRMQHFLSFIHYNIKKQSNQVYANELETGKFDSHETSSCIMKAHIQ